mmetsp:Transcript_26101/g.66273  ORF Transcript_26101/g.66273 Transcript_26101/m.66273 type:complete len:240 (+) Transcript_26101:43-762(+)
MTPLVLVLPALSLAPKETTLFVSHTKEHNLYHSHALVSGCTPNSTHGCLDNTPYDFALEFPCGSHGVYKFTEESCCEQGRAFDTAAEYCCTGSGQRGVHSYNDGKCDLSCPDGCQCYDAITAPSQRSLLEAAQSKKIEVPAPNDDNLIDTTVPPEGGYLCTGPQGMDVGCMNGFPYNYSTHAPCGQWLMAFGSYGCCPGPEAFLPYPMGVLYCCKIEGAEPGKEYALKSDPCQCHRYGC